MINRVRHVPSSETHGQSQTPPFKTERFRVRRNIVYFFIFKRRPWRLNNAKCTVLYRARRIIHNIIQNIRFCFFFFFGISSSPGGFAEYVYYRERGEGVHINKLLGKGNE